MHDQLDSAFVALRGFKQPLKFSVQSRVWFHCVLATQPTTSDVYHILRGTWAADNVASMSAADILQMD